MILNEPFNKESLNTFLKDFLPDYQLDERSVRTPDKSILTEVTQLGASRKAEVTVLEAECEETDTNRRIAITQAAFKVLREHSIRNAVVSQLQRFLYDKTKRRPLILPMFILI